MQSLGHKQPCDDYENKKTKQGNPGSNYIGPRSPGQCYLVVEAVLEYLEREEKKG